MTDTNRNPRWIIVESDKGPQPAATGMMLNSWYLQRVLKQELRA